MAEQTSGRGAATVLAAAAAWLLVAAVALLPLQGVRWLGGAHVEVNQVLDKPQGTLPSDLVLLVAGGLGAAVLLARRRLSLRLPRALVLGEVLMLAGGVVGLVWAQHPDSAGLLWRSLAVVLLCQVAVWGAAPSGRRLTAAAVAYVAGASVSGLAGVVAVVGGSDGRLTSGTGRAVGLAANATTFAVLTSIALALAAVAALEGRTLWSRRAWGGAAVLLATALAVSGSRGIVLTTLLVAVLLCWRAWRIRRRSFVLATAVVVASLVVLGASGAVDVPVWDRLLGRQDTAAESGPASSDVRFDQLGAEVERRGAHSLLVGSGLRDEEPTPAGVREGVLRDPHTAHLEVWLGLGAIGLVGWVLVLWSAVAPGARLLRCREVLPPRVVPVAMASVAAATYLLAALTANNLWNRYVWVLIAFSALVAGRRDTSASAASGARRPSVGAWWRSSEWTSTVAAQPASTSADASAR